MRRAFYNKIVPYVLLELRCPLLMFSGDVKVVAFVPLDSRQTQSSPPKAGTTEFGGNDGGGGADDWVL